MGKKKRLSASEVSAFCEHMSLILNGGISIYDGIHMLYQEMDKKDLKHIFKEIDASVKEHVPLHEALENSGVFPSYMVHMVKIGEKTDKLEVVLNSLAKYYARENELKESIKNVMFYPFMLFVMMGVILLVLVVKILPMFENVFRELDANASKTSSKMMDASIWVGRSVATLIFLTFALIVVIWFINKTKRGKRFLYRIASGFPYVRKIMYELNIGKFISAMSLMISSGMTGEESLELAVNVVDHMTVKKRVAHCIRSIKNNGTLEDSLRDSRLITGMNGRLVSVGAKTGVLGNVFAKLSDRQDEEINKRLNGVSSMIETVLILLLSAIVGIILISVMLPLISIISSVG